MIAGTRLVLDASVILKWALDGSDEQDRQAALELLDGWRGGDLEILVPTLWLYEVGNILCLKRPDDAEQALAALRGLGLVEVAIDGDLAAETVAVALGHGVTFYDAAYLAVARRHGAVLVTADGRFLKRLPEDAPARLLASLGS